MSRVLRLPTRLYQQFDADLSREVPAEAYGGWKTGEIDVSLDHTAVVVMHAWDCGQPHEYPGWRRAVEYYGRAEQILREVFPPLLESVRRSPLPLFHVVGEVATITRTCPASSVRAHSPVRRPSTRR